jgi:hypothetical protein
MNYLSANSPLCTNNICHLKQENREIEGNKKRTAIYWEKVIDSWFRDHHH